MGKFLKTDKTKIIGPGGRPVYLHGVNLGGWLMMEAYFMHSPNFPESLFRKNFAKHLGGRALREFDDQFRKNFITQRDFQQIRDLGFNCIRVPFHYRLIEQKPFRVCPAGVKWLDKVIQWAAKAKLYVILDMHAVPGAQNGDWHSDSDGKARFWSKKENRQRALKLWEYLADRYKDKTNVAGYDLLNEAVVPEARKLNAYYRECIRAIRNADRNHILFIEGNTWARDIACLDRFADDNHVISIHYYELLEFTFNFVPHLFYPSSKKGKVCNMLTIRKHLEEYERFSAKRQVPIFVGEFGVNARQGVYGEHKWVEDILECFEEFGFHWTYWTYKAIKNYAHPDGIFSYKPNPPWVSRGGPLSGWQTYHLHWEKHKREMARSWQTDQFSENTNILKVLQKYV